MKSHDTFNGTKQKNDETEMELSDEVLREIEEARKEKGGVSIDELAAKKVRHYKFPRGEQG